MKVKNIKAKVAAKVAKGKAKVAAKAKGGKACKKCALAVVVLMAALCTALSGCKMGEQPTAQRAQTADTKVQFLVYEGGNATFTFGAEFVSLAQANETSGTEAFTSSPTSTPTVDVKPDIDVAYNDAIKSATDASKGVLEKLTDAGAATVLKLMSDKSTGAVVVPTKDGGMMTVKCENGQCSDCTDGSCTP